MNQTVTQSNPFIKSYREPLRLGETDHHHFFGYYNKTVWDKSGRFVLGNRVPFMDHNLTPDLIAEVGYFDLQNNRAFVNVGHTSA